MSSYPSSPPPGGQQEGSTPFGPPGSTGGVTPGGVTPGGGAPGVGAGQGWLGRSGVPQQQDGPPGTGQGGATAAPPVCPRHPDRVAYVRCQRCGRPACPECQRTAAVGIHCVDCVRQAQKGDRQRQTVLGGRARPGERPLVTMTLIGICVAVFLLERVVPGLRGQLVFSVSSSVEEPWRLLTTAFVHAPGTFGVIHLLVNMMALWFTGPFLEQALGRARFLALYLVSALGGSVAFTVLSSLADVDVQAVGASGAVFGLFGAVAVVMARLKLRNTQILGVIAINVVIGFVFPFIAWEAHLGGLLTGAVIAALYAYLPKNARRWGAVAGVAGVVALLVVALVVTYGALGLV